MASLGSPASQSGLMPCPKKEYFKKHIEENVVEQVKSYIEQEEPTTIARLQWWTRDPVERHR